MVICEVAKLSLCCFRAELRSFRVRNCPKPRRFCFRPFHCAVGLWSYRLGGRLLRNLAQLKDLNPASARRNRQGTFIKIEERAGKIWTERSLKAWHSILRNIRRQHRALGRVTRERPGFGISRLDRRASAYREVECHRRSFLATADVEIETVAGANEVATAFFPKVRYPELLRQQQNNPNKETLQNNSHLEWTFSAGLRLSY